jgi:hypothetical protein
MKTRVWRWGAAALIASLCPGAPSIASAQEQDEKDKKKKQLLAATGEEDSDAGTPGQLPAPPAKPAVADGLSTPKPKPQVTFPVQPGAQIQVAPGAHYAANGLHTMLLGEHYRPAWTTPVQVKVLDLAKFAGGLKPVKKGGGKQTLSLTFDGGDGHRYKFRTIEKDPTPALDPDLRKTAADKLVQDQISASHPGSPLIADGLSKAAGILYVDHRMFLMPDDDRLGEFRQDFGGQLGYIEMVADEEHSMPPGFEGITKVVESAKLVERIDNDAKERVDARSYLKARLFDMFIGDWDRHMDQFEWVRRGDNPGWEAYPKDRDLAFIRFDGLLPGLAKGAHPSLLQFGPLYPKVLGLAWNSRVFDRRLLSGLDRPVYLEVARELQQGLTDDAIDASVRRLPPEWFQLDGERFITSLKSRRDRLPEIADAFYRFLAGEVELHGTNAVETVDVRREENGTLLVVMRNDGDDEPLLQRRFKPGETRELRFYLKGGDDRVTTLGTTGDGIDVRVAGGPGDDVLDDSQGGGSGLYDSEGENRLVKGKGTFENDNYWVQPADPRGYPARDWGGSSSLSPWARIGADLGLLLGVQWQLRDYGFRRLPYSSQQTVRVGYSTERAGWKAEYIGDFRHTSSFQQHRLRAMVSEIELVRFYGFGNETTAGLPSEFFKAEQTQYLLSPSYRWGSRTAGVWLGAVGKYSDTKLQPNTFLGVTQPYGVQNFGQVGPQLTFLVDTRDNESAATRGLLFHATGIYYPRVWSVDQQFADTHGEVATYLSPGPFTLALRVGGKKVFGDELVPFHEAAFIGGPGTVRGLRRNRFAGDASAFGNAELRLRLGEISVFVPIKVGLFGFGDVGRVFVENESSDLWHAGIGGGLSLGVLRPENTVTLTVAWPYQVRDGRFRRPLTDNAPRFYLNGGFAF